MERSNFWELIKDLVFPPLCSICGRESLEIICENCQSKIKVLNDKICSYCGKPFSGGNEIKEKWNILKGEDDGQSFLAEDHKGCSFCRNEGFNFYRLRSYSLYQGEIKKIIKKFKYNKIYALGEILTKFLVETYDKYYRDEKIDFIDTVPDFLNKDKIAIKSERANSNHMQTLCQSLSRKIGLPFVNNIIKIRQTCKQQGLDLSQRKNNLAGAFKVKNCLLVSGKNVLLVDDVWTTGSTLNEISKVLKNSKANKIYLLTIARGV